MNAIRNNLASGAAVCGAWISMGNTQSIEVMGKAGYDFLLLDTQHGGITWEQLLPALQVLGGDTPALVRVSWRDPAQIMRAADLGAAGVVVPMVSTAAEAQAAVEAIRYPPLGNRSFGPIRSYYSASKQSVSASKETVEPLCLVMIETVEAMQNLDAIVATPGLDGVFVGPMDLALSLGCGISATMPQVVLDAIDKIVRACERHGIIAGSASLGMANAEDLLRRGVQFVTLSSDFAHLRKGATAEAQQGAAIKNCYSRASEQPDQHHD